MTKYLFGVVLLVACSAPAFTQQLIPQDDSKDPCRRFKMRVLVPPDHDKAILAQPGDSTDPKMIWNPCQSDTIVIASLLRNGKRDVKNNFVIVNATPVLQLQDVPVHPAPFLIIRPQPSQP
jgi:hypothetical protein